MKELMQRSDGPAIRDTIIWLGADGAVRRARRLLLGHLVVRAVLPRLRRALRLGLRLALARVRPWHGVQDALDERRRLPDRLLHDHAQSGRPGAGAMPATTPTPSSSAATPRSPSCGRRDLCASLSHSSASSTSACASSTCFATRRASHATTRKTSFRRRSGVRSYRGARASDRDLRRDHRRAASRSGRSAADADRRCRASTALASW